MVDDGKNVDDETSRIMDELEFEPVTHHKPRKRLSRAILMILVLLTFAGGVGWYFLGDQFKQWFPENGGSEVPFIRADTTPIKVRPKNPGGMDVPNRDKLIYGRLRGAGDSPPLVERLMPPAETPLPVPKPETPLSEPKPKPKPETPLSVPGSDASSTPPVRDNKPSADMTKSLEAAVSSLNIDQPKTPPAGEVISASPPASPPVVTKPGIGGKNGTSKTGEFYIQVGAVRSPGGAKREWQRLRRKNPKLLGNMKLFITKADLGPKKGIFYRLRAGPIADEATTSGLCRELTKRKVGCLIVRPGE